MREYAQYDHDWAMQCVSVLARVGSATSRQSGREQEALNGAEPIAERSPVGRPGTVGVEERRTWTTTAPDRDGVVHAPEIP